MSKKIGFNQYEYDRILFLNEIIQGKNFKYLNDNKIFLEKLLEESKIGIGEKNLKLVEINEQNRSFDILCKNREFFEIINPYIKKFRPLYGHSIKSHINEPEIEDLTKYSPQRKMLEDLYFVFLPFSRFLYKEKYRLSTTNNLENLKTANNINNFYSPIICGIQAHQGCGKTTLTNILKFLLKNVYELNSEILSIDDVYLTYKELNDLKNKDQRFKYRGPPGTHDMELTRKILENVKKCKTGYEFPRYNKSANKGLGDRAEKGEYVNRPVDVLLFEGWFLGSDPVDEKILENFQEDKEKLDFQKLINKKLYGYQPLWNYVDYWVILKPKKFEYSRKWRAQAEKDNKQGMGYKQMQDFLNYFWLTVPPSIYFPRIESNKQPVLTITLDKFRNYYI
jgi:D-glycerate 3-kinase